MQFVITGEYKITKIENSLIALYNEINLKIFQFQEKKIIVVKLQFLKNQKREHREPISLY